MFADPKTGKRVLNAGFLAVRYSPRALRLMDAWYERYQRDYPVCFGSTSPCAGCVTFGSYCPKSCRFGGPCDDQGVLNLYLVREFDESIERLPLSFQDFSSASCNSTVKHFAAGQNLRAVPELLARCGNKTLAAAAVSGVPCARPKAGLNSSRIQDTPSHSCGVARGGS